jgi:glutathione peroxidase
MTINRRALLAAGAALIAGTATAAGQDAFGFSFPSIEDGTLDFAAYKGRVLLVANTASFCGYTYQYEALEKLYATLEGRGLTVVGVPSQDFNQEKDNAAEVKAFCEATFGVQFPMTGILHVRGPKADPFYRWVRAQRNWEPSWNFNKVLIGRNGQILGTYASEDEPQGPRLRRAIETALAAI